MKTQKIIHMTPAAYVEIRDSIIDSIIKLTEIVYPKDKKMRQGVVNLCTQLEGAEQSNDFVSDIAGFVKYCNSKNEKPSSVLTTIIHDLSEFARNRNEAWFCPRTNGYRRFL